MKKSSSKNIINFIDPNVLEGVRVFHAKTNYMLPQHLAKRVLFPPLSQPVLDGLVETESDFVPTDALNIELKVEQVEGPLLRKRSAHQFASNADVSMTEVKALLVNSFCARGDSDLSRPYPSGGALYPVEVLVALTGVSDGPEPGAFHVRNNSRSIERCATCTEEAMIDALLGTPDHGLGSPAFALIYAMNLQKALVKYRWRGYRLAMLEAGAMFQQADLISNSLGLRTRLWAGFSDHRLCNMLQINPSEMLPLVVQLFGK